MKLTKELILKFTQKIFRLDMMLNWFLGGVIVVLPKGIERVIVSREVLPIWVCWVIGIGFLGFAWWQLGVVRRGKIKPKELKLAGLMAWVPVVLLTAALVLDLPLRPVWRWVLWLGDLYMAGLASWYFYVAGRIGD